ncbi:MAG: hypothetical protein C4326_13115 [Ignavibacteria bacterium]
MGVVKRSFIVGITSWAFACVHPTADDQGNAGNRNPVIESLTAAPAAIDVGSSAVVTVVASDPENQPPNVYVVGIDRGHHR